MTTLQHAMLGLSKGPPDKVSPNLRSLLRALSAKAEPTVADVESVILAMGTGGNGVSGCALVVNVLVTFQQELKNKTL